MIHPQGFVSPLARFVLPTLLGVSYTQLETLPNEVWKKFPSLCPEFVLELRSHTDRLEVTKEKMLEYMENGAELGWLVDPLESKFYIYTPEGVEELDQPQEVTGTDVLEGFRLELVEIW